MVVKKWDNKTPPVEKQVVFVTNIGVKDPFIAFDRYDDRSRIKTNRSLRIFLGPTVPCLILISEFQGVNNVLDKRTAYGTFM